MAFRITSTDTAAGSASFDISAIDSRTTVKTGEPVFFEPSNITGFDVSEPTGGTVHDDTHDLITWIWDWDDAGATWSTPGNSITEFRDNSIAYGKFNAHQWSTSGTKTVSLFGVDQSGNSHTATLDITVQARADADYPTTRTICFDAGGTFTGAPSGCAEATTFGELQTAISNLPTNGDACRILFVRGTDLTVTAAISIGGGRNVEYIGTFGSGAKPIIRPSDPGSYSPFVISGGNASCVDCVVEDMDCRGTYDTAALTGTVAVGKPIDFSSFSGPSQAYLTQINCDFDGLQAIETSRQNSTPFRARIEGCSITNSTDFLLYHDQTTTDMDGRISVVGSRLMHNVDNASDGSIGVNAGTGVRLAAGRWVHFEGNDIFTRGGWPPISGTGSPELKAEGPATRFNSGGYPNCRLNMCRNVVEGGTNQVVLENNGSTPWGNYIIHRNIFIGSNYTHSGFITSARGGTRAFDNYAFQPDVDNVNNESFVGLMRLENGSSNVLNTGARIDVYHNTAYNAKAGGNKKSADTIWIPIYENRATHQGAVTTNFTNYGDSNNLMYHAGMASPYTDDVPLDTTTQISGITLRHKGTIRQSVGTPEAGTGSDGDTLPLLRPQTGNPAIDDATSGTFVYDDIFQTVLPVPRDRGCIAA